MIRQCRVAPLLALVMTIAVAFTACGQESAGTTGRPTGSDAPAGDRLRAGPVYIALGDSLSAGFGASDAADTSFVPLVHRSLGDGYELINLGHGGDTSQDLIDHGHLSEAVRTVDGANSDDDGANDVSLVTLEIGGNDLLGLYFSAVLTGVCPDVETTLSKRECYESLEERLTNFDTNLGETLDQLLAADPSLRVLLLTLYDPFSGLLPAQSEIAAVALEGAPDTRFPEGLNDIIREHANQRGLPVVDLYEPFQGRALELISGDFIHPNDAGYRVMADAVTAALAALP